MRAGQCVDAVDLHKPKAMQHLIKIAALAGARAGTQQQVPVQKQAAGRLVIDKRASHRGTVPRNRAGNSEISTACAGEKRAAGKGRAPLLG